MIVEQTADSGIGPRLLLSPRGVDVAVAVGVFGASVVNVAAQDGAGIGEIPVFGFLLLAVGSVALLWRRGRSKEKAPSTYQYLPMRTGGNRIGMADDASTCR